MKKLEGLDLEGKRVLDAGTGACDMTKRLEKEGAEVISIDIERERLKECHSQTEDSQLIQADLSDLNFIEPHSFDHVICNFLVSALSENKGLLISSVLREFYKVLTEKGSLIIIDYYPFSEENSPSPLDDIQVDLWRLENAVAELLGEGHLHEYSPEVLQDELKKLSFQRIEISTLLDEVPWPRDLFKEHEDLLREDISRVTDKSLRRALKRKLEKIMDSAEGRQVRSGSIYELRAFK